MWCSFAVGPSIVSETLGIRWVRCTSYDILDFDPLIDLIEYWGRIIIFSAKYRQTNIDKMTCFCAMTRDTHMYDIFGTAVCKSDCYKVTYDSLSTIKIPQFINRYVNNILVDSHETILKSR